MTRFRGSCAPTISETLSAGQRTAALTAFGNTNEERVTLDIGAARNAARILGAGRLERRRLGELPPEVRPSDEDEAYMLQDLLHERLMEAGRGPVAGHKIGCTTPIMQEFLGIDNPCAGGVFGSTSHADSGVFRFDDLLHPGVECEMAVRLGADLTPAGLPFDRESVAPAVDAVIAAIEVVDDRWADYKTIETPTLIADDFFGAGCVLGDVDAGWRALDPTDVTGSMTINGEVVGRGRSADIMGHPFNALAWLSNLMAGRGKTLRAGEFVLLGSIVETRWVSKGDLVEIELKGLGTSSARFE